MFKKIALATDGSDHSIRASRYAVSLATQYHGSIDVLYVIDGDRAKKDNLYYKKDEIAKKRREDIYEVEQLLKESGVPYAIKILHGEPGPTLIKYVESESSDCIVLGSRGLNNFQTFLLGSVSDKVAKRS